MRQGAGMLRFRPRDLESWAIWGAAAVLLVCLPLAFGQGFARTMLTQMGIMIIVALSFNMLLGASGMLSFGHAVYSGLGAFFSIHALNWIAAGRLPLAVPLLPLVGGLGAACAGVVFGYVTTRRSGTPFAMITLGIGEMVYSSSLMFPGFFGGEGGITGDRTSGVHLAGLTLGPQLQVYYLTAAWCLASMAAMYALTQTPLGRLASAVRDNPERAEFIGYNTQRVRWMMLILSSFFAGISGALSAINFEIVTAENVSPVRSGAILVAAFIGGAGSFFGPVLGAVVFVLFAVMLSGVTRAWQLYLGAFFVALVMFAPAGLAGLVRAHWLALKSGQARRLIVPYAGALASALAAAAGVVLLVEMCYHRTLDIGLGPVVRVFGRAWDTGQPASWAAAVVLCAAGGAAFVPLRRRLEAMRSGGADR